MEILILHPGGLGDLILSLPAIALIRRAYPAARITLAGNIDHLAAIVSGYAERVVSLSSFPLHHLYVNGAIPEADAALWRSFDWIVSWTGSGDPVFARNFTRIHPNVRIAPWRPVSGERRHVSQIFVDSLAPDIPPGREAAPAQIQLDAELCSEGIQWLAARGWNGRDRLIALHAGAGSLAKRWPLERFIDLAKTLAHNSKVKLLIIDGPAEPGLAREIVRALPEAAAFQAGSIPLNLLAAVLVQCEGFVGNDSGIAHLAAALGAPSAVLFGPTLPQHWAPQGSNVTILRNTHRCKACTVHGGEHTCLSNISVEEVIGKLILNIESNRNFG